MTIPYLSFRAQSTKHRMQLLIQWGKGGGTSFSPQSFLPQRLHFVM